MIISLFSVYSKPNNPNVQATQIPCMSTRFKIDTLKRKSLSLGFIFSAQKSSGFFHRSSEMIRKITQKFISLDTIVFSILHTGSSPPIKLIVILVA